MFIKAYNSYLICSWYEHYVVKLIIHGSALDKINEIHKKIKFTFTSFTKALTEID